MNPKRQQATLDLQIHKELTFSSLVVGLSNNIAINKLEDLSKRPSSKVIILFGARGSGKSLLSKLWQNHKVSTLDLEDETNSYFDLSIESSEQISERDYSKALKVFDIISSSKAISKKIVIDNFDLFSTNNALGNNQGKINRRLLETKLFDCLEDTTRSLSGLLITTKTHPHLWQVEMVDLKSRLDAVISLHLTLPDDETLKKLLLARLDIYGMRVKLADFEEKIFPYLVVRMERSYEECLRIAKNLYDLSLLNGGILTIPLAKQALQ